MRKISIFLLCFFVTDIFVSSVAFAGGGCSKGSAVSPDDEPSDYIYFERNYTYVPSDCDVEAAVVPSCGHVEAFLPLYDSNDDSADLSSGDFENFEVLACVRPKLAASSDVVSVMPLYSPRDEKKPIVDAFIEDMASKFITPQVGPDRLKADLFPKSGSESESFSEFKLIRSSECSIKPGKVDEFWESLTKLHWINKLKLREVFSEPYVIPNSINVFSQLTHLNLSRNKIVELPESMSGMTRLVHLKISLTPLRCVGSFIGSLVALEILEMPENLIVSIDDSIGNLLKLKTVNLFNNDIKEIPNSMGNLPMLEELNVELNCLTVIPDSILEKSKSGALKLNTKRNNLTGQSADLSGAETQY